jgi:cysteinyl-tRNA synthetase
VARVREAARALRPGSSPEELEPLRERFFAGLAADFNTSAALAAVFDWVREANRRPDATGDSHLREMLDVLGLANLLEREVGAAPDARAQELLARREAARAARDFAAADALRDELAGLGWQVRDGPAGPELVPER